MARSALELRIISYYHWSSLLTGRRTVLILLDIDGGISFSFSSLVVTLFRHVCRLLDGGYSLGYVLFQACHYFEL